MGFVRSVAVFSLLLCLKYLSRVFYKHDFAFVTEPPRNPWGGIRLVAFLNHTSLFEPVFLGGVPVRWEQLDENLAYQPNELDRAVVAPDQIRTVIRTFRDRLFTEIFPGRSVLKYLL